MFHMTFKPTKRKRWNCFMALTFFILLKELSIEYSRDVMTYWNVLGEFGGLQAILATLFGFIA